MRYTIVGLGGMLLAGSAAALSLGPAKGVVLLGAPVDLVFEIEPDPGTSVASSCVTADLLVGDVSIASEKVRVLPLPEVPGRAATVRVRAAIAVDEPVVQVKLSAGCSGKVSRTYIFLADLPVGASSAAPVDIARIAPPQPQGEGREAGLLAGTAADGADARSSPADGSNPSARPRTRPAARPAARPVRVRERPSPQVPKAAAPARPVAAVPVAAAPARSRLVMEPLDGSGAGLGAEAPAALHSSRELASAPSQASTSQRAEAAASWKALNASGAGVQSDTERMRALEVELATLRARSAEQQTGVAQLQRRLDAMEKERFAAAWVYALLGLLAAAVLTLSWFWQRARQEAQRAVEAWHDAVAAGGRSGAAEKAAAQEAMPLSVRGSQDAQEVAPSAQKDHSAPLATQLLDMPQSQDVQSRAGPLTVPIDFSAEFSSGHAAAHIVHPEELFDVQQQAEFFVSVGEHEQAIDVLKKHIAEHEETSPLAYLELLQLYHVLGRAEDFERLRVQFQRYFNAQVPGFKEFGRPGKNLEHYPQALEAIEAAWATPEVQELLEQYLFERDGGTGAAPFDLAAFDDLLLLLAIVQTTPPSARAAAKPKAKISASPAQKSPAVQDAPQSQGASAAPMVKPAAASVQKADAPLDIDFDFGAMAAQPAPPSGAEPKLDLDLSDLPPVTRSDLPPVPVTAPPHPDQPVGFGVASDKFEARVEWGRDKGGPK